MSIMHELLRIVSRAGQASNTHPFLVYGTLLGHARHRSFICYDFDVDVGIFRPEYDALVRAVSVVVRAHPGFEASVREIAGYRQCLVTHVETGINADIFEFIADEGGVRRNVPGLYSTMFLSECRSRYPVEWFLPLRRDVMAGVDVFVPNDVAALLSCYYGTGYIEPDHECNIHCTKCTKKRRAPPPASV